MSTDALKADALPAPREQRGPASAAVEIKVASRLPSIADLVYQTALDADVQAALDEYEWALDVRDSVSRKLCGGSTFVTVDDLARWEEALSNARSKLARLAKSRPILTRHPTVAASVAHS